MEFSKRHEKKYKIIPHSFHSGNNENCYNYATVNFDGKDNKLKIITKSPITNILYTLYNKKFFECICSFKVSSQFNTSFFKKLFIQSSFLVRCYVTPNVINLDKSIINNIDKIKNKLKTEGKDRTLTYREYSNYYDFLTKKNKFKYDELYKNDYKYYFCLYSYLFLHYVSNQNFLTINNDDFINYKNKCEFDINSIEEYLEKINDFNRKYDFELINFMEKYNFIRDSEHFILLPSFDNIITINDILNLQDKKFVDYLHFRLQITYKNKLDGVVINSLIDVGFYINLNEKNKDIWLSIIQILKKDIYTYFIIIFGLNDCRTALSIQNHEIIEGIESDVVIWTSIHPIRNFFYFEAEYKCFKYNSSEIMMKYKSNIFIYDIEKNIKNNILQNMTYVIVAKKKDVPFYYYNILDDELWNKCSDIINNEMKEEFFSNITEVDNLNSNDNFVKNKVKNISDIKEDFKEHDDDMDKFNEFGVDFVNLTRDKMIEKIKSINLDLNILKFDCDFKLYGYDPITKDKYVLYIITKKIKNDETENILNSDKKIEIFPNLFLYSINYKLYLHKILQERKLENFNELENFGEGEEGIDVYDITKKEKYIYLNLNQHCDELRKYVKVNMDEKIMNYIKTISLNKFIKDLDDETITTSDIIFTGKQLKTYIEDYRINNSFPSKLLDNKVEIFDFTRFLMVTNCKGENPVILNSFEIKNSDKKIKKNPYYDDEKDDDCLYSNLALIISPENKIDFEIKEGITIDYLKTDEGLKNLIKSMITYTLSKSDYFRMVGYICPWRNSEERVYNLYDLKRSDLEHITLIVKNYNIALVNFINGLEIPNLTITNENIEAYFHYPAMNADIHIQFKINKIPYILNNRRYFFSSQKTWDLRLVLELLKINYFEIKEQTCLFKPKTILKMLEIKNKGELLNIGEKSIEFVGGSKNNKFIDWIDKYLNVENIFKIYALPIVWIDFEIVEEKKPIRMENKYLEYAKCTDISKYNITVSFFDDCMSGKYFNITKTKYNVEILENLLIRKFAKVIYISKIFKEAKNKFYVNNKLEIVDYKTDFETLYDLVIIAMTFDVFERDKSCKLYLYLKKNIVSLIWALKHLNNDGCIEILIRETLLPSSNDLLLLLQQFSSVSIFYDLTFVDGLWITLRIICTDFREKDILIKHLEKILKMNIDIDTGFLKIKKIIRGDIDKFNKTTLKPSLFLYNRVLDYINCFKNEKGEFETMTQDIKDLIIVTTISLASSKLFIPKPEHMPYISSLLHLKKMKIGDKYIDIHSNIKKEEGKILYKLIKDTKATKILEIGMAFGLSSLFILQSLKYFHHKYNNDDVNYKLTSIDPFQLTQWNGLGIQNLKNAKLYANHKLIEEKSFIALPELIKKKKLYDIIFIDGWHTFDYTLNDLFISFLLVKLNGYIVIDDALHPGVNKVLKYIQTNYQFLKKIDMGVKTLAIYLKIGNDKREWNFHKDF
jgi:predicted O-methyltransferase YrrM